MTAQELNKVKEVLKLASFNGKMKRVWITVKHQPLFKKIKMNSVVGDYMLSGSDDNGKQFWITIHR